MRYLVILGLLVLSTPLVIHAQAPDDPMIHIVQVDSSAFPQVNLQLRLQDANGQAILNLDELLFDLSEAHTGLTIIPSAAESPLNLALMIDLTAITAEEQTQIKSLLGRLGVEVLRDGDSAYIYLLRSSGMEEHRITDVASFSALISGLTFSGNVNAATYEAAYDSASKRLADAQTSGQNAQLVVITAFAPPQVQFQTSDLPVHVIHAHSGQRTGRESDAFALVSSAGQFVRLTPSGTQADLETLFKTLNENRRLYELVYRSQAGESQIRTITLIARWNETEFSETFQYTQALQAPSVTISASGSQFKPHRVAVAVPTSAADSTLGYGFSPATEELTIQASFPDGVSRNLLSAQLLQDGQPIGAPTTLMAGQIEWMMTWDISNYLEGGATVANLAVQVTDELGLQATSPIQPFEVTVERPEEVVQQIQVTQVQVTQVTQISVTQVATIVSTVIGDDPCIDAQGQRLNTAACQLVPNNRSSTLAILIILGIATLGFGVLTIVQRRTISQMGKQAMRVGRTMISNPQKAARTLLSITGIYQSTSVETGASQSPQTPAREPTQLYAEIHIVRGPKQGEIIQMTKPIWSFGREVGAGVDYVFRKPNISSLQCTITYDRFTNTFVIEDKGSGNGTYVNNLRLQVGKPHALYGENEIRLAHQDPIILRFMPMMMGQETAMPAPLAPTFSANSATSPRVSSVTQGKQQSRSEVYSGLIYDSGQSATPKSTLMPTPTKQESTEVYRPLETGEETLHDEDDNTQFFREPGE